MIGVGKQGLQGKMQTLLSEIGTAIEGKSAGEAAMLSSEEEEKLATNVLFTMSTYFIELTELCMRQMQPEDVRAIEGRLAASKDSIHKLFSKREESKATNRANNQ